jgi:hypothetical protein
MRTLSFFWHKVPVGFVVKYSLIEKLTVALLLIKKEDNRTQTKIAVDTGKKIRFMSELTFQQNVRGSLGWLKPKALGIVRLL